MWNGLMRLLVVALLLTCGVARAGAESVSAKWPATWRSPDLRDHPLVGRIYAPHSKTFVTSEDYLRTLSTSPFILLGEVHDNPDHHILQALAIANLKPHTVVFEHFSSDQQTVIGAYQAGQKWMGTAGGDDQVERLFLVTGWAKSGWPDKVIYRPLIEAVLASGAKIVAGNVPRRQMMEVAGEGLVALSEDARRAMWLDRPLGGGLDNALLAELEASHCGLVPKSAFGNMAVAQRLRDAHLAQGLAEAMPGERPVVLVAGNGHVRLDRGVPWYLGRMTSRPRAPAPDTSVGHVEVIEGKTNPADYLETPGQYSFVVFTPRAKRDDPCVEMRKRFEKRKAK